MKKLTTALALLALLLLSSMLGWNWLRDHKLPNFGKSSEIFVTPDMSYQEVVDAIDSKCHVTSRKSLDRTFKSLEVEKYFKPGHYWISHSNSSIYAARMLNNGWQAPVKLTLSGNLRLKTNIAAKIASQLMVDSATVVKAFSDKQLLSEFGATPATLFSFLMPDTYDIYWTASVKDILTRQKEALEAFWTEDNLAKAKALHMSVQQVSTLASIVKAETNYEPEMPKVAGVYLNRLKIGMPLQADPTVAFCFDYKLNRVLNKHLEYDSPYNTYRNTGLPPGPICVPTRAALQAVLDADYGAGAGPGAGEPTGSGNLYFCANAEFNGTHAFAKTLTQHNANAAAFQKELNRRAAEKRRNNGK